MCQKFSAACLELESFAKLEMQINACNKVVKPYLLLTFFLVIVSIVPNFSIQHSNEFGNKNKFCNFSQLQ